jgi:GATA-binding protein
MLPQSQAMAQIMVAYLRLALHHPPQAQSQLARTVVPRLHHFGEGMMLATSFAMPVVRCPTEMHLALANRREGLYYKLHGTHRPVAMKKQEIKRRKRVVPVGETGSQAAPSVANYSPSSRTSQTPAFDESMSPDPSNAIDSHENYTPEPRGPLAVDFTHYYGNPNNNASVTSHPGGLSASSAMHPGAPSPRKRSLSATMETDDALSKTSTAVPHRPNAISLILNHPRTESTNIDPSLSVSLRPSGGSSPNSGMSQEDKVARRERLIREAEVMRRELERRQKELDELEND